MTDAAVLAGRHLDLVSVPFTLPRSRVIVFRADDGVRVHTSEYERRLSECRVLDLLTVVDVAGELLPVTDVLPAQVMFGGGAATLTFADPSTLSIGGEPGLRVRLRRPDGSEEEHPLSDGIRLCIAADRAVEAAPGDHAAALAATERIWAEWFAKCPIVRDDLQEMAAFCWWVLGANIVELPSLGDARAIVPSKIGYVGLWQWDAYFIAVGLRHGDPELAREQLDIAFRFPQHDGQLPDVVHELGVLATSDDLPESDRANLRRAGSQIADPTVPVPLTKPPLAAWALRKVLEVEDAPDYARVQLARIVRSQDWWFAGSDLDHDGMPEYGHPYSSGLDDSPIFDGPLPTAAPDLGAYLVRQDEGDIGPEPGTTYGVRLRDRDGTLVRSETGITGNAWTWDVASAGADAPVITPGTPADVALRPAGEVRFVLAPEQKRGPDDAHAGLVKLRIPVAGTWRVAASGPVWIDLIKGLNIEPQ